MGTALTEPTSYNAATNRITGPGSWSYETRGNITVDPGPGNYTYNAESRLTHYSGLSGATDYTYDGDGLRVKKVSGATTTVFVYDAAGELAAEYTTPAPALSGRRFFSVDHLGSTRLITDAGGAVLERHDYRPFGDEVTFTAGQVRANVAGYGVDQATRVKFTGNERDAESGLDYFGARYLSSAQGRWMIPDWSDNPEPVPYASFGDPQSLNLYVYVRNGPLRANDPTGHANYVSGEGPPQGMHWVNDQGQQPKRVEKEPGGGDKDSAQQKQDNLSNVVENETSSIKPDPNAKAAQPGSAEDLAAGRLAVAEVANRVIDAGHPDRVASSTLYDSEAAGLKRGDPAAVDAHNNSGTAAEAALNGSNTTNGATQYRTRVGSDVTTALGKSKTNPGTPVSLHYGPFIEGKHTVVIVVAP